MSDEIDREIKAHLEQEAAESGDPRAARRAFGNVTHTKESIHDLSRWLFWEQLAQDLKYGARMLAHSPGFSIVAVLTLALGMGANTAIFSVVNAVLLRPLPFAQPERLVRVWEASERSHNNVVSPYNFFAWRDRNRSFERIAAISAWTANLSGKGEPLAASGMQVTPEFFEVLRTPPLLGRTFVAEDGIPGQANKIVLSYGFWQSRFAGDPAVIGSQVAVNGEPVTVVGVMPASFHFPGWKPQLWAAMPTERVEGRYLSTVARLKAGVTLAQARDEMRRLAGQLAVENPAMDKGWSAEVVPLLADLTEDVRLPLLVLLAAVGVVLLTGCANVANLLLMRATRRTREIALRAALGAGRRRILQQLLAESLLLALTGWAAGLAFGYFGLQGLIAALPAGTTLPRMESIRLDGGVFVFTFGLSLLTAVAFGIAPAVQASRPRLQQALQQGSARTGVGGNRVLRRAFVIAEVALALVLLSGAGLLLRSFARLTAVDPGFTQERVLTMSMFTSPAQYQDRAKRARYFERLVDEIRRVPGVEAAGTIHFLPLTGSTSGSCFEEAPGRQPDTTSPDAEFLIVSPGYFETMGTRMVSGRNFDARDRAGQPSALVNHAFAEKFFKGRDPVGRQLNVCWTSQNPVTIAGVVADARQTELQLAPQPTIFLDNEQAPMYFAHVVVRTRGDTGGMARAIESAIHRVDPEQAISGVASMREVFAESVSRPRFQLVLLLVFAGMAVLLASIGVYGVVSYSVTQRTQEIGIRVALGARSGDVSRLVLGEGLMLAAAGVAVGMAGALAFLRVLRGLLFQVQPTDPATLAAVAAGLLLVSIAATLIPARRAARVNPVVALRYE